MQILNQYGAPLSRDELTVEELFEQAERHASNGLLDCDPEQILIALELNRVRVFTRSAQRARLY